MRLGDIRAQRLFTQASLARAAGVNRGTINAIEGGKWSPALETIRKLSEALQVDPVEVDEFREAIEKSARGKQVARVS